MKEKLDITNNFVVEDLGIQEIDVYDIEVENDHNFFGNNICVHNSVYMDISEVVLRLIQKRMPEFNPKSNEDMRKLLDVILVFIDHKFDVWTQEIIDIINNDFNSYNVDAIGAKLEKIAVRSIFTDKKRYAMRVIYDEGDIRIENPKIAVTGLDIVQSSTPKFCRKELKKVLDVFFDGSESDIQKFIEATKGSFEAQGIEDISRVSGVSSLDYQYDGKYFKINENGKRIACPINSRASLVHNKVLNEKNLTERFQEITAKDKIKYVLLKMPNPTNENVMAYLDPKMLEQTGMMKYVDYDEMFEKFFVSPMKIMMTACNYSAKKATTISEWF